MPSEQDPAMPQRPSPPAALLILAVRLYQWLLRPLIGGHCRYHPSCSEYALAALREHGAWRGGGLALWRILRCNPWMAGGIDPVPPRATASRRTA
jgi:putative membrane protein insertion efficiency factor